MKRYQTKCPKCSKSRFWKTKDGRLKCKSCRYIFTKKYNFANMTNILLRQIISEFILEHSTNIILERVNISKYKLLKILNLFRIKITNDKPETFKGIVEVDETYMGGQMKNKRLRKRLELKQKSNKKQLSGFNTIKQPIFGILCRNEKVWATLIDKTEAKDLQPIIQKQVEKGSIICSDSWRAYTGIAQKGYIHRTVNHGKKEYSDKKGNHINGLEGFWGYLKRKLSARGGIRKEKLPLYLGEYVWRYNHKNLNLKERENLLFKLLIKD